MKKSALTVLLLFFTLFSFAQTGKIKGKILDSKTCEPMPFVNIVLEQNGKLTGNGTVSDINGNFSFNGVLIGKYDLVTSYVGFIPSTVKNIEVKENQINFRIIELKESKNFRFHDIYGGPCIFPINPIQSSGQTWTRDDLENSAW